MPLQLVNEEECSTKGGMRKSDRKKLEDKKKEISTAKELIIFKPIQGHNYNTRCKYKCLIYWDTTQNRQRQKFIKICRACGTELTEQNRAQKYLLCKDCRNKLRKV